MEFWGGGGGGEGRKREGTYPNTPKLFFSKKETSKCAQDTKEKNLNTKQQIYFLEDPIRVTLLPNSESFLLKGEGGKLVLRAFFNFVYDGGTSQVLF